RNRPWLKDGVMMLSLGIMRGAKGLAAGTRRSSRGSARRSGDCGRRALQNAPAAASGNRIPRASDGAGRTTDSARTAPQDQTMQTLSAAPTTFLSPSPVRFDERRL